MTDDLRIQIAKRHAIKDRGSLLLFVALAVFLLGLVALIVGLTVQVEPISPFVNWGPLTDDIAAKWQQVYLLTLTSIGYFPVSYFVICLPAIAVGKALQSMILRGKRHNRMEEALKL